MTRNQIMRNTLGGAIYLIFAMMAIVLFTLGPRLETLINPVMGFFEIKNSWREDDNFFIEGALLKNRGECEPTGIFMYADGGLTDENAKSIRIDFTPDPAHYGPDYTSRPAGAQYWGPWQIIPPAEPIGPVFTIVVTHRCHALWELTQVIYSGLTAEIFPGMLIDEEITNGTTEFPEDN